MTDRPILFSAPMVRAIIREIEQPGTGKTQTRRVIDFDGIDHVIEFVRVAFDRDSQVPIYEMKDASGKHVYRPAGTDMQTPHWSPRYAVGDRLWVRETFCRFPENSIDGMGACSYFKAEIANNTPDANAIMAKTGVWWVSGRFMPREFSRLTLTVTDVRVQRLQEISDADARTEGVILSEVFDGNARSCGFPEPRLAFRNLWDSINADRAPWDSNPWVVAVTFTPALGNIDQVPA